MKFMENLIRGIDDTNWIYTLKTFRRYGFDPRFGPITVMIHPENLLERGDASFLVANTTVHIDELTLRELFRVLIIDGNHCDEAIIEMSNNNSLMFEWPRIPLLVYLTLCSDGYAFSYMDVMKDSKLFNNAS